MKVLFLTPRFYPSVGGVERHVFEVATRLKKKGVEVLLATERAEDDYQSSSESDSEAKKSKQPVKSSYFVHINIYGISVWYFNFGKSGRLKKFRIWYLLFKQRKLFAKADVVHCHDVFIWYFLLRFLYPRKKVFITFHGYESYPVPFKNILIRKLSEILSSGNICVGDYIKRWYHTNPTYITYGGVSIKEKRNTFKRKINTKLKILFLGRIDEDTGVKLYVKVLDKLKEHKVNFDFIACGDGKLRNLFEKYGKVTGFVRNTGKYVTDSDIIFSSSYLSILESLVEKKIIISVYQNPLKKSYLMDSPLKKYITISNNVLDMAKKIIYYSKSGRNNNMTEEGFIFAKQQTWDSIANMYMNLWTK